ncbi:OmpA family protein [Parahaliea sp. F7430]|uniref:OmpA family protein n=1 Tax=Sediminihaliea albiluteola TaxID=2758564 RepID=A0A7W2YK22_9GAMM|nr:OmpA family protein [Sediminihaliea albiluteola]MBA6413707.1 OmpA family protein [Sediminihaliea albiluteola]
MLAKAVSQEPEPLTPPTVGFYLDVQNASLLPLAQHGLQLTRLKDHIHLIIPGAATFDTNSASLTPAAQEVLDLLSSLLLDYDKTLIAISGHSDSLGDPNYNQRLSEQRADAVGQYLNNKGVLPRRLVILGLGSSLPLVDNDSPENRAINRRVELELWPLVSNTVQNN